MSRITVDPEVRELRGERMTKMLTSRACGNANALFTPLLLALILSMTYSSVAGRTDGLPLRSEGEIRSLFEEWQVNHDKSYQDLAEKRKRFEIFRNNLRFIDEHNRPGNNHTYTVGLNHLADLSNEEYRSIYLNPMLDNVVNMSRSSRTSGSNLGFPRKIRERKQLPSSIDWRDLGAVGPVKNQGQCASCWAFTAIATVEGINAMVTGDLVTLSEQELVDCDDQGTHCGPGLIQLGYDYIIRNGGVDTDANYPYQARQGQCKADTNKVATIDGYGYAPGGTENDLRWLVASQPVGSAVDASGYDFQLYTGGIFDSPCSTAVNHAVTIVGYDTDGGVDYWIIKNSYGQDWGEGGYLKLRRNVANSGGLCGIAMWPTFPVKMIRQPAVKSE